MDFLANDEFRSGFVQRSGIPDEELAVHAVTDPRATVTHDVQRLPASPRVTPRIVVSGHVLDLDTGVVSTVAPASPHVAHMAHGSTAGESA